MTAERPHTRRPENSGGTGERSGPVNPDDIEDPDHERMYSGTGRAIVTCPYFESGHTERVPAHIELHELADSNVSLSIRSGPEVDPDSDLHISHGISLTPGDAAALGEQLIEWAAVARERRAEEACTDD